ncbi:MAG: argininosuccinate lyase [Lachnospiraceae bacterium]|nr:argininosuccinate lyase [Lachnospiraceae bacterium]
MNKMWAGLTSGETNKLADDFNSSIAFDCRMFEQDIKGSMVHAAMLASKGIIAQEDADKIVEGLQGILADLKSGALAIDENAEDIHMFVEEILTERIGDAGKKLHTARSRNDQVALDLRLYLRDEITGLEDKLKQLMMTVADLAAEHKSTIMPGYTHLQRAQPITFAHQILTYAMMFRRDLSRLEDCKKRMNISPIGSCALAGTTYDTDRYFEAEKLGFDDISLNSIDGVSDRDFCVEFLACASLIMVHLSRFSEEIILWSSWEFKFIELSSDFTTGSSIMPQKKNSDMAELTRGKSGRVFGDLMAMLTMLKGLPLAYNKDMQEDKEAVFDAVDTLKMCLDVFTGMVGSMTVIPENMLNAAGRGFINATDLADYLVKKGMPFRDAYKISGKIVNECMKEGYVLETFPMDKYQAHSDLFTEDVYEEINLKTCVEKRKSAGGPSVESVEKQIEFIKKIAEA